ncbi:unnamed protein product [Pichia kudriavzevii]
MSFWDNHKDSIKAGGISVLKGAGKATKAVSKAGYSAYKNHNSKSNAAPSEEQDSHQVEEGYMPAARDDPKSFPPPPKHVAAYGTQGASHMVQQQQHISHIWQLNLNLQIWLTTITHIINPLNNNNNTISHYRCNIHLNSNTL